MKALSELPTFLSVCLGAGGFYLAFRVIQGWRTKYWSYVKNFKNLTAEQYLIVGVVTNFIQNKADSGFWNIVWTGVLKDWAYAPEMMEWGPFANIFFRNLPHLFIAYCHLKAISLYTDGELCADKELKRAFFVAGIYAIGVLSL